MSKTIPLLLLLFAWMPCVAQLANEKPLGIGSDSSIEALNKLPARYFGQITAQQQKTADKIQQQNEKIIKRLYKSEQKFYNKLGTIDSIKARELAINMSARYEDIQRKMDDRAQLLKGGKMGQYIPRLDSLATMLHFLQPLKDKQGEVTKALAVTDDLKGKLAQAADIKAFLAEREDVLKNLTNQFTHLPTGIIKQLGKYSKEVYYYKEKMAYWRESINDPQKVEQAALKILNRLPVFQQFMKQNGELAQLFGTSTSAGSSASSIAGFQTRALVQQLLQQQLGAAGVNPQQYMQQQMQAAQSQLTQLKDKLAGLENGSIGNGESAMPAFAPNNQKARPFMKRLTYQWNLQTGNRGANSFPSSNDLGFSVGFKLTDRFELGLGGAYKFGLGTAWNKIAFTSDGIGLRSYVDFKISSPQEGVKALFSNIWISGGYEQNYWAKFRNIPELRNVKWQQSGLLGISKKVKRGKREIKAQALWDFLKKPVEGSIPIVFRVGYSL